MPDAGGWRGRGGADAGGVVTMLHLETIGARTTVYPGPGPRLTNGAGGARGNEAGQEVVAALFSVCDIRHWSTATLSHPANCASEQ